MLPAFLFGALVLLIAILVLMGRYLKKMPWSARNKRIVFSLLAAFLVFPILLPAGTIAALPAPNFIFLILAPFTDSLAEIPIWYFKTAKFSAISYLVTFVISFGISQIIFFERKQAV